jgi:antitoxin component HigA of HigAB toxin-antitoxin module
MPGIWMETNAPLFGPTGTLGFDAIKTEDEYLAALDRITELVDAEPDCPEGNELELLGMLIEAYEARLP